MTTSSPATAMRYRDVGAAADWLCEAFGFEKQTVLADAAGGTLYAQLTFGRALMMLAPVGDTPIEKFMKQPDEVGGAETQSCYFVVADADAHHARAKAAGAAIVLPVEDDDFGGRGYTCRDPEGHIWTFGTYDPWQGKFPEPAVTPAARNGSRRFMQASLTAVALVAVGVAAWIGGASTQSGAVSSTPQVSMREAPATGGVAGAAALRAAEQAAREARAQLERERAARASADNVSDEALRRAAEAQQAREAAERAVKEVRAELEQERLARKSAGEASNDALKRAAEAQQAREAAERAVRGVRAELEHERTRKAAAETPAADASKRIEEARRAREAAERSAKEARAALEKVRADKVAAEMAKEFALGRAEEEQAAREAAERAAQEARAALDRQQAARKPAERTADAKALADLRRALDQAQKRGADEQRAREAAEQAAKAAHEQLAKEQKAKAAAWKVIGQLTRQLKQVQGKQAQSASSDASGDGASAAPARKARRRPRAKAKKSADGED